MLPGLAGQTPERYLMEHYMNAATPAARLIPTPVQVLDFCDEKCATLSAHAPFETIPATVAMISQQGCLRYQLCMRPDQARSLAIALGIFADYADELQTIADEAAQQVQP